MVARPRGGIRSYLEPFLSLDAVACRLVSSSQQVRDLALRLGSLEARRVAIPCPCIPRALKPVDGVLEHALRHGEHTLVEICEAVVGQEMVSHAYFFNRATAKFLVIGVHRNLQLVNPAVQHPSASVSMFGDALGAVALEDGSHAREKL